MFFRHLLAIILLVLAGVAHTASLSYYLPDHSYDANVVKPSDILEHSVGERHIRHDQLVEYFQALSAQSDKVVLTDIGRSYQQRKQLLVTISSAQNLQNIEQILAQRKNAEPSDKLPIVVWLGYSVHGDEISGAHASMLAAYYFAASQDTSVSQLLDDVVIVMEPSINPDGMDRFTQWASTYRNKADNTDPNHIEHHQDWVSGRTNHYWFDLNRDWLLLTQQESQNRLKYFHHYQPNVLGDFHEMGAHSSYFFQPGIPSRTNPLTPQGNISLTHELAKFHAKALDAEQRLYYSEESFDDFYYGKGSTYPDINGSVGILFEQASSRGLQTESINGLLTFEFGIKNHLLTSLSTVEGAWKNKQKLAQYQYNFYRESLSLAQKAKFSGYLVHEPKDKFRLAAFLDKLAQHQIIAYPLSEDFRLKGEIFHAENSLYIPLEQKQYRLIEALFTQPTDFVDNTFYDVSGWTLPLAMNIEFHQVGRTWGLKLEDHPWQPANKQIQAFDDSAYAYAIEWHHYQTPKLLQELLTNKVKVKVAEKPFSSIISGINREFEPGTLLIPAGIQENTQWREFVQKASNGYQIPTFPINTGLTPTGIDLGSNSFDLIEPVNILMIGGRGISQYEAGEMRYYLDEQLDIPVTIVENDRLATIELERYSHIILVDGQYSQLPKAFDSKLINWLKKGGVIYGQKRGAKWLMEKDILNASAASKAQINAMFDTEQLSYQDKEALSGRKRIAGAIFSTELDLSHPLAFGYRDQQLPIFKNSTLIFNKPKAPFVTVAKFTQHPLISGYTDKNLVNRIAHNAAVIAHNVGKGRVVASSENLVFRGYWHGTAKILANTLFFAKAFSASGKAK